MEEDGGEVHGANGEDSAHNVQMCTEVSEGGEDKQATVAQGRWRQRKHPAAGAAKRKNQVTPKREKKEPASPTIRTPRERKSIERFAVSIEKERVKEFKILKGPGTPLKDIPNVVFRLSKRKGSDEVVQLLHKLLYGKPLKSKMSKPNILQFSGYVWSANEDKEKLKVRERFEKCIKENLLQLCDILDLHDSKKSDKKEDLIVMLFKFLESPHKTTARVYEEEGQMIKSKKRKALMKGVHRKRPALGSQKRQKQEGHKRFKVSRDEEEDEENIENEADVEEDEPEAEASLKSELKDVKLATKKQTKHVEEEDKEHSEDYTAKRKNPSQVTSRKRLSKPSLQSPRKDVKKISKEDKKDSIKKENKEKTGVLTRKKTTREMKKPELLKNSKKSRGRKSSTESSGKGSLSVSIPSDEELCTAISILIRDVDMSTVTFKDVVKQLGVQFGVDLTQNKSHVKLLIQEEIKKIIDEEDRDGDRGDGGGDVGKGEEAGDEGGNHEKGEVEEGDAENGEGKGQGDVQEGDENADNEADNVEEEDPGEVMEVAADMAAES